MEKKIIAIALVLVLMVTAFVGCGKKYETTVINNSEYVLATDKDGNAIINNENKVAIYPTDENGKFEKNEEGETVIGWVELRDNLVNGNMIVNADYAFSGIEGWHANEEGAFVKDGTTFCQMRIKTAGIITETNNSKFISENFYKINEETIKKMEDDGNTIKYETTSTEITKDVIPAEKATLLVTNSEGKTVLYSETFYFEANGRLLIAEYSCFVGEGYDETFNFKDVIDNNLVIKKN